MVDSSGSESAGLVAVAVPLPLPGALTYRLPPGSHAAVGARVRVRVGKRRLVGFVTDRVDEEPEGVRLRSVEEVLDPAPVLSPELLELARFASDYYLAALGEVLKMMVPSAVRGWGERRLRLTDGGAFARPRDEQEAAVLGLLIEQGPATLAQVQRRLQVSGLAELTERLSRRGWVRVEDGRGTGSRYRTSVELRPGQLEEQLELCGRSPKARAVVEYLRTVGRPAVRREVEQAVGCGAGVVRRLVQLGVLRQFTEIERVDLGRHRLGTEAQADELVLFPEQHAALESLVGALDVGDYRAFLLSGVTGSGKTEVYLRAIEHCLALGKSAIILVPEIALVPALARSLVDRFGDAQAILHSNLGRAERQQEWERIFSGQARVVLGPRSAIFAPMSDLGLVVVDEEHDPSYKQDIVPRYNGRDLALVRAQQCGGVALLASATPSLESRFNVERQRLRPLRLTRRVGQGELPKGVLVDLRQEPGVPRPGEIRFSQRLHDEIAEALERGEQIILLRNRRGYSPILLCRACGEDLRCDDCGLPRTYHRRDRIVLCHYCGSTLPAPRVCGSCGENALEAIGAGTERVEEQFCERFPDVPVGVLDRDTTRRPGGAAAVLERFGRGDLQVLIGTQMVAKGHHFPNVSLTGVLLADSYLGFPDFRAVERTYALLTQVAGRAGRGERPGRVVIQTYHPEHYAIRAAMANDDAAFEHQEMKFRRTFHYPPYTRMVLLLSRSRRREKAEQVIHELARSLASSDCGAGGARHRAGTGAVRETARPVSFPTASARLIGTSDQASGRGRTETRATGGDHRCRPLRSPLSSTARRSGSAHRHRRMLPLSFRRSEMPTWLECWHGAVSRRWSRHARFYDRVSTISMSPACSAAWTAPSIGSSRLAAGMSCCASSVTTTSTASRPPLFCSRCCGPAATGPGPSCRTACATATAFSPPRWSGRVSSVPA